MGKLLMLRQLINGTDCIAIDPENEYSRVAEAADGQIVRLAASSAHHINPFDLPPPPLAHSGADGDRGPEGDPLAERVAALLGLLDVMLCGSSARPGQSASLDNHERAVLDRAIYRTYAEAGITSDLGTHGRAAPLLGDLHAVLDETPGELAVSLAVRLERYMEGLLSAWNVYWSNQRGSSSSHSGQARRCTTATRPRPRPRLSAAVFADDASTPALNAYHREARRRHEPAG